MIIDLNIQGKIAVVIGGGNEAGKRVNSFLGQGCRITVITDSANAQIKKLVKAKKIELKNQRIQDTKFISELKPDIIIAATNDKKLNQKIINTAKRKKILVYSSDNPEDSDFSNPSIIDFEEIVQIAIFTGGQSPAMSKKIRIKAEKIFKKIITHEDIGNIKIQSIARRLAKETIKDQPQRKEYLHSIMTDNAIDQLIKDGQMKKAEKRAITMLRNWK